MAIADEKLIGILIDEDAELAQFVEHHKELDGQVRKLEKRRFLTPDEQIRYKILKQKKLMGKDRIQRILQSYRQNQRAIF